MTPLLIGCAILLIVFQILGTFVLGMRDRSPDFRSFYTAGYLLRTDRTHLYDMDAQTRVADGKVMPVAMQLYYFHPAYEAVLDVPLSWLPFKAAYRTFMVLNVLMLIGCVFIGRSAFSRFIPWIQPGLGLSIFFFAPLLLTVAQGQDSILFLLLVCVCWHELERDRDANAGVALALALFRFQLAIPLAILLILRRGWNFGAAFVATGAVVVASCFALVGVQGMRDLLLLLRLSGGGSGSAAQRVQMNLPVSAMANLRGLLSGLGTHTLSPTTAFLVVAIASFAVLAWSAVLIRRTPSNQVAFAIAALCAILVSYHMFLYDLTLLILPVVMLAGRVRGWLIAAAYLAPAVGLLYLGIHSFVIAVVPLVMLFALSSRQSASASEVDAMQLT
ncbi:Protein of unknown function [Bryocella elongata]|uniref:DUF2029 domain-containing protein n=2 Tax=Bryocella elongata TaxID=863522 RepID=A0A1H5T8I1_9BACT|nr:Protein of unknown function [Bryocella elongata]